MSDFAGSSSVNAYLTSLNVVTPATARTGDTAVRILPKTVKKETVASIVYEPRPIFILVTYIAFLVTEVICLTKYFTHRRKMLIIEYPLIGAKVSRTSGGTNNNELGLARVLKVLREYLILIPAIAETAPFP